MGYKKKIQRIVDNINKIIDKTHARTVLLTTLVIIFVVFCLLKSIQVRIVTHETVGTIDVHLQNDTLMSVTQSNDTIKIPDITIKIKESPLSKESKYINEIKKLAIAESKKHNIPASIKVAQSALESGWGEGKIVKKANNYFGIKKKTDLTKVELDLIVGRIKHKTSEYVKDKKIDITDEFCVYNSRWASFRHHSIHLRKRIDAKFNNGYSKMKSIPLSDYKRWAKALEESGYSTDPEYAEKLINIIKRHKLYELDE